MIRSEIALLRILGNISIALPLVLALFAGVQYARRAISYPSVITNTRIETKPPFYSGQVLVVSFTVQRLRTCTIEVTRVFERVEDSREFEIGFNTQLVERDDPPLPRQSSYTVQIPSEFDPGHYVLFSRLRYLCGILDLWSPWIQRTQPVALEVEP